MAGRQDGDLPLGQQVLAVEPVPLVPQGIVAAFFVAGGTLRHSWFLATYMEPGPRYPVAGGFILLGPAMYGAGYWAVRLAVTRQDPH